MKARNIVFAVIACSCFAAISGAVENSSGSELISRIAQWKSCTQNSNCTVVEGVCGGWVPVNKLFTKQMTEYQKSLGPDVECMPPTLVPKPATTCMTNLCRTVEKPK